MQSISSKAFRLVVDFLLRIALLTALVAIARQTSTR
jgi:hypothetical protein